MNKSIYDEAIEIVDESLYQPDNSVIFNHLGLNLLKKALEKAQKQENLLGLYRRLYKDFDDLTLDEQLEIEKQIKELENE